MVCTLKYFVVNKVFLLPVVPPFATKHHAQGNFYFLFQATCNLSLISTSHACTSSPHSPNLFLRQPACTLLSHIIVVQLNDCNIPWIDTLVNMFATSTTNLPTSPLVSGGDFSVFYQCLRRSRPHFFFFFGRQRLGFSQVLRPLYAPLFVKIGNSNYHCQFERFTHQPPPLPPLFRLPLPFLPAESILAMRVAPTTQKSVIKRVP